MFIEFIDTAATDGELEEKIMLDMSRAIAIQDNGPEGTTIIIAIGDNTEEYDIDEPYPTVIQKIAETGLRQFPQQINF